MSQYSKFIAALISVAILMVQWKYGINFGPVSADILTIILFALNPIAVYWFPNKQ